MERDCKREKRVKNWDEINMKSKEWGETVREPKREKHWGEINIKPKEWGETVRDRRAAKETGARQKVSRKKNGAISMSMKMRAR